VRPFNLPGRQGPLSAIYYQPQTTPHPAGDILLVPAFTEEMNRCRAMVSMQARELARLGVGTLVLDPYGTGDSGGEFSDASWELWRDDLTRGVEWLRRNGNGCRTLWGVRLGALMSAGIAQGDPGIERLLWWQPVVDGKAFFTQFLRIRIAAELEQNGGIKSTEQLRKMSAAGEIIEVSGYRVSPQLATDIDLLQLPEPARMAAASISWFEVVAAADSAVPRANAKVAEALQAAGADVRLERVIGPPFWQVHEREVAPNLIAATNKHWSRGSGDVPSGAARALVDAAADNEPENPVVFSCGDDQLMGVVHRGKPGARRGVVIVVAGGPQYRAGAHRQFVSLARKLAARGYPVLRFDLRGMGDSSGEHRGFQHSDPDQRAAIDALISCAPSVEEVVLFGECESASGILFYAFRDPRVKGIALVNPWVRTEGGRAEVIMKHYYLSRLLSADFWHRVRSGKFDVIGSARDFIATCRAYLQGRKLRRQTGLERDRDITDLPLPVKTAVGLRRFNGPTFILMSGNDYIAREFDEVVKSSRAWDGLLQQPRICRRDLLEADHTFSRENWKRQASDWVCEWVASW
jgi:exosortase A-associated hydrolase 1/exosortase A-associated hydrolase 2